MRLIDADNVLFIVGICESDKPFTEPLVDKWYIRSRPVINAIPVQWIKAWGRDHCKKETIRQVLNDWSDYQKRKGALRLIDADEIVFYVSIDKHGQKSDWPIIDKADFDLRPTVDAILRRWIKVWGRRHDQKDLIRQLLDDWSEHKDKQDRKGGV